MVISAMGNKFVVLGLVICLVLSSFHEVSCQVEGSTGFRSQDQGFESNVRSVEQEETSSVSSSVETESEAVSGQRSSSSEDVRRLMQGFNTQSGSDGGASNKFGESTESVDNGAEIRKQVEEMERKFQASKIVAGEESSEKENKLELHETQFEDGELPEYMINEPKIIESSGGGKLPEYMINEPKIIGSSSGAASTENRQQYESKRSSSSSSSSSSSEIVGSLGIGQSGAWRCFNQDKTGAKEDDPIVIPKYDLNDIIKQESTYQGSSSKTSSLITSLTEIVEKHKKGLWSTNVKIGKVTSKETSEKVEKIKVKLKNYRGIHVRELVTRSDFEEILTLAARYEELSKASVTYISRLSTYGTVIKEGFKASQRVQTVHQRVKMHESMAVEKQKKVDAEFEAVKAVAQKGDMLYVKIFAMKRLVLKLEAEKEEADMEFQKSVASLSRVLEEASQTYEKYHVVEREWKEVQASVEYSRETIERAEVVWVQFLNTL